MGGRTRGRVGALALAGLMALQGCGSVAPRGQVDPFVETRLEGVADRAGSVELTTLAARPAGGLEPTSRAIGFGSRKDAAALLGVLILALPFLLVYGVVTAPFAFVAERL